MVTCVFSKGVADYTHIQAVDALAMLSRCSRDAHAASVPSMQHTPEVTLGLAPNAFKSFPAIVYLVVKFHSGERVFFTTSVLKTSVPPWVYIVRNACNAAG